MRWLAACVAQGASALILGTALTSLRWRAAQVGPPRWGWLVLLSRALLCAPLLILPLTAGRWPSFPVTAAWLALASLLTVFADIIDRLWTYRVFRARSKDRLP
jgi:hypothetical protein